MMLGTHVFDYGFGELFLLGLKRPRRETGYSPLSNTEFKNRRNYASPPPYIFMECKGTKLRESYYPWHLSNSRCPFITRFDVRIL